MTLGFCFVEYKTPEEAHKAVDVLQGYTFDKNHSLSAILYERTRRLSKIQETEFRQPEPAPFVERPNPMAWLEDPNQRDAFVVRHARETIVYWFDGRNDPVVDYDGSREKEVGVAWCEYYCHWSPKGSYLATLVPAKGVILWSGKEYEKLGRFKAPNVEFVLFSPDENYFLTSSSTSTSSSAAKRAADDAQAIKVFSIKTGELLRAFPKYPNGFESGGGEIPPPPPFLWSFDDKYLARMGKDLISIYETPSMKLLDRRSLSAEGIHEFQWSPKQNVLSYWVREQSEKNIMTKKRDSHVVCLFVCLLLFSFAGSRTQEYSGTCRFDCDSESTEITSKELVQCHEMQHGLAIRWRVSWCQGDSSHQIQKDPLQQYRIVPSLGTRCARRNVEHEGCRHGIGL